MDTMIKYYKDLFSIHGYSPNSLGWQKGKQFLRFHQLTSDFNLANSSILDVGCGFGDFIKYIGLNKIKNIEYYGVDVIAEFIIEARKNNPKYNFINEDFLNYSFNRKFDYLIASGTFNFKIEGVDGYKYIFSNLEKMFELCNIAISVDFISSQVDYTYEHNFNSDPFKILEFAYSLSKRVLLKNNYFPFEFSIIIFKNDSFKKETTVFNEIEENIKFIS